jgi:hypothetical protein
MVGMDAKKTYYITFQSETVVFDGNDNKLVGCPTEDEAKEYIEQLENMEVKKNE